MLQLQNLFDRIKPVPSDWFDPADYKSTEPSQPTTQFIPCTKYADLVDCWKDTRDEPGGKKGALYWSDSIDVSFSVMLAIVNSTPFQGDQVWLRVIGPPGSVKTTLCEAINTNHDWCISLSMQTGLHSGQGGHELFSKLDRKTAIINEGDMLLHAPNRDATLAQMRDMWSGVVRAIYRNGVEYNLTGLRTTWIVAGTKTLRQLNRSSAGDRFLDTIIFERATKGNTDKAEMDLLMRVADIAESRCKAESNGDVLSQDSPERIQAFQMTAGFVKHLRETSLQKVSGVVVSKEVKQVCVQLALIVAYMRTRPDEKAESDETEVELATRLTSQFIRLVTHLAVVLDRPIDAEVLRRAATVARHTSYGRSLKICEALMGGPLDARGIGLKTGYRDAANREAITLLSDIGCIKADLSTTTTGILGQRKHIYRLTPQMTGLLAKLRSLLDA